jgi:hypothetical protein
MAFFWGATLALATLAFAVATGFDRERAFYPVITIVVATYYDLFAVMGGSMPALGAESVGTAVFAMAAVVGLRWNLWVAAAALTFHGVFDFTHDLVIANPGVPGWWPAFCGAYDVVAGPCLAWLILSGRLPAKPGAAIPGRNG